MPPFWLKNDTYLSLAFVHGSNSQHSLIQPWKWLHGVLGQMGLRLIVSRRLYFGLLYNISNFHGKYFDLFHTPPFYLNSLLFGKRFDCFIFQRVFFFFFCETWSDPWGFWAEKNFQWGLRSIMSRGLFGLSHKISNFILHDPIHDPLFRSDLVLSTPHMFICCPILVLIIP